MKTAEYRKKYAPRHKKLGITETRTWTPAGSIDINNLCDKVDALSEALRWALDYIDAIPSETAASFPTMPGFDRDYVEGLLS